MERLDLGSTSFVKVRDELQRHGIGRREHLQLPDPSSECRGNPEPILRRCECSNRFAYDRSSQIALNEDGSWRKSLKCPIPVG